MGARSLFAKETRAPSYLGRTFAVGFFATSSIFYGQPLQCLMIWLVMDRLLKIRFNLLIAGSLTLISSFVPTPLILYVYYITGQTLLRNPITPFSVFSAQARAILASSDGTMLTNLWAGLKLAAARVGWPVLLGSVPWKIGMVALGYCIGLRIHWKLHKIMEEKKEQRKAREDRHEEQKLRGDRTQ